MSHAVVGYLEGPVVPSGKVTPSQRLHATAVTERQWEAARERFLVARYAAHLPPSFSLTARLQQVADAKAAGILTISSIPTREQLRALLARWAAGSCSLADYLDGRRRSGVPRRIIHPDLQTEIEKASASDTPASPIALHRQLKIVASRVGAQHGTTPWVPSKDTLRILLGRGRTLQRSAAQHGAAAAEIDALPHSTVPAVLPHDVWTLDEFTSRRWCGVYDDHHPEGPRWVSYRPDVVVIIDNATRVIVGYWVVDPTGRTQPEGPTPLSGYSADDVLSALLAAAIPALGTAATRPFAGHLPHGQLRWDNAKAHAALTEPLKQIGIEPPDLPAYRPINRGIVERLIGTLKHWEHGTLGHQDAFVPADRVQQEEEEAQAMAAATTARRRRRTVIDPMHLPRLDEFRRDVERLVYRYNYEHRHRSLQDRTPAEAYKALFPRRDSEDAKRMRRGADLLALLPVYTTAVTREGVMHRGERFAFTTDRRMLMVGTPLTYRADPGRRGLLVEEPHGLTLLPPLRYWAKGQDPAQIAETQAGASEHAAALARAARAEREALLVGHHLLERAADAAAEARATARATGDVTVDAPARATARRRAPNPSAPIVPAGFDPLTADLQAPNAPTPEVRHA
jgi:transposase InsO family protein